MIDAQLVGVDEAMLVLRQRMARLADMTIPLAKATGVVYEATRQHYETNDWPPLAESTIARKASQGYAEPDRPLYAEGNLFESATSPSGPYSTVVHPTPHSVVLGIDWDVGGWQIPMVLSEGTQTAGRGHSTVIPSRPIWAPVDETYIEVGTILLEWLA